MDYFWKQPENRYLDKLVFKNEHYDKAWEIYSYLSTKLTFTHKQVGIFGCPGSGKSEISFILKEMVAKTGHACKIFHLDSYYKVPSEDRDAQRKLDGIIGVDEINWAMLLRNTTNNFNAHFKLIIVEGLYAAHTSTNHFLVYVKGNEASTREFRIERGKENVEDEFRKVIIKKEIEEVEALREKYKVDLVV